MTKYDKSKTTKRFALQDFAGSAKASTRPRKKKSVKSRALSRGKKSSSSAPVYHSKTTDLHGCAHDDPSWCGAACDRLTPVQMRAAIAYDCDFEHRYYFAAARNQLASQRLR